MSDVILYSIAIRFRLLYDTYVRTYPSTVQRVALALPLGQLRNAVATLALNCVYYYNTVLPSSQCASVSLCAASSTTVHPFEPLQNSGIAGSRPGGQAAKTRRCRCAVVAPGTPAPRLTIAVPRNIGFDRTRLCNNRNASPIEPPPGRMKKFR